MQHTEAVFSRLMTELSEDEKERLAREFLPFIRYTAFRLSWRLPAHLSAEDLVSVGVIGLLEAISRYVPEMGKVNTFVEYRIRGAMLDELRKHSFLPQSVRAKVRGLKNVCGELERGLGRQPDEEEIAEALGITLDEYFQILSDAHSGFTLKFEDFNRGAEDDDLNVMECISDPGAKTPLELLEERTDKEILASYIGELPEKEKLVLSLYYWDEMTLKEIGKILGLSEGRICQIHAQALMRLKVKLNRA